MSETDYAYFAGLIDGEGALDLGIYARSSKYKGKIYRSMGCSPKLTICLKNHPINKEIMVWLAKNFRGNFTSNSKQFKFAIWGQELKKILLGVLPYLKIKKAETVILLKALEIQAQKKSYWNYEIAEEFAKLQDRLFSIRLKNRGHMRKWTGNQIIKTFSEIMRERKDSGIRSGVLERESCAHCGKPLTKNQIWSKQTYCSHKCYIERSILLCR